MDPSGHNLQDYPGEVNGTIPVRSEYNLCRHAAALIASLLMKASRSALIWSAWGCRHSVRIAWIHLQLGTLHNLRGLQTGCGDRHGLIVVAMKNEGWHVELLQVLGEVGFPKMP
jgi:hypothetical protein